MSIKKNKVVQREEPTTDKWKRKTVESLDQM
jgi:hypothetical protein